MKPFARRHVLTGAASFFLAGASASDLAEAGALADAITHGYRIDRRSLWLRRPDGSEIMAPYRTDAGYERPQVLLLSWFMRDVGDDNHAVWIEPRLFDLLAGVQAGLSMAQGKPVPLIVTSGYRTPAHNAQIETAARNSMHLYGYAADLKAPGFSPRAVAVAASFYAQGGIGLYDSFTHLDVWKVRTWVGPARHAPS